MPTVHTNPSQKRSFSKTLKLEEFENAGFYVMALIFNLLASDYPISTSSHALKWNLHGLSWTVILIL